MTSTTRIYYPRSRKAQLAKEIIVTLQAQGFTAFLAGGSVRDLLLGRAPKDYDIVTSARPDELERYFPKRIPVGEKFGISIVRVRGFQFEIATFRGEGTYSDRRRPDAIYWTDAKEDALRRDFTINALFYDPISQELHDFIEGERDLATQVIRFVGDPLRRVQEDSLRMLRAVRLKNSLGFQYDAASYQAIKQEAHQINRVSPERIREELDRMWREGSRDQSLRELSELGILKQILPEIERLRGIPQPYQYHQEGDVFEHTVRSLAALPKLVPTFLVWAVLFHDAGKAVTLSYPIDSQGRIRFDGHKTAGAEIARSVGVRLHMPRTEIETIAWLVDHHMNLKGIDKMREAKRRLYLLDPRFRWLLEVHRADAQGTLPRDLSLYQEVSTFYQQYLALWKKEQLAGHPQPLITGDDLTRTFNLPPGPQIGQLLAEVHEAQLEHRVATKQAALALVRKILKQ